MKISNSQERLIELLSITGDTQSDMVKKTGIEKSAISNYIRGKRVPRQDKILMIANAYNVNPSWLMGLDVPMTDAKHQKDLDAFIAAIPTDASPEMLNKLEEYYDFFIRLASAPEETQRAVETILKSVLPKP